MHLAFARWITPVGNLRMAHLRTSLPVTLGQLLSSSRWIEPASSPLSGQVSPAEEGQNAVREVAKNVRLPDAANREPDATIAAVLLLKLNRRSAHRLTG
ncbi:hypothetical protein J2854_004717 [Agrobacterium tumefaciens]|nr:hypothetical protein [Agrobacterium tumefaciens]